MILFTDIAKSTHLWNSNDVAMRRAVDLHHHAVRKVIARHGAYEVKTIGDSFMIACHTAEEAMRVATDIHVAMMNQPWPEEIIDLAGVVVNNEGVVLFEGLRVCIGVEITQPFVVFDDVSKGYDYYGNGVNTAARINHACPPGTTLLSRTVKDALEASASLNVENAPFVLAEVGDYELRGLKEPLRMFISAPLELAGRISLEEVTDLLRAGCNAMSPSFDAHARSLNSLAAFQLSLSESATFRHDHLPAGAVGIAMASSGRAAGQSGANKAHQHHHGGGEPKGDAHSLQGEDMDHVQHDVDAQRGPDEA